MPRRRNLDEAFANAFYFRWWIPDGGYEWDWAAQPETTLGADPSHGGPYLVPHRQSKEDKVYFPLDDWKKDGPPLFRIFADLDGTSRDILAFANTYGGLGIGQPIYGGEAGNNIRLGESIVRWNQEIQDMREVVEVWDCLKMGKPAELKHMLRWDKVAEAVLFEKANMRRRLADAMHVRSDLYRAIIPSPKWMARGYILERVNGKLRGEASPRLILNHHRELTPYWAPHNLLAALWLQLFQATTGQRPLQRCIHCHQWMDVSGYRKNKRAHARCIYREKTNRYRQKIALDKIERALKRKNLSLEERRKLQERHKILIAKLE